ncbi:High mobility group protein DSP1 [Dufourea novaeangliae]|uniref:High mobility group protein DSP1 n=1 Tax=Dufourea novaeangliae TaxID=178035 RepID=A0A154PLR1_DUFNO|nr:High mobility group protein DSP1 [Dufourea novaeangliae]
MSEHHRVAGGWGTASPGSREDGSGGTAWWPSGLNAVSAEQQQQQQQQQQQNLHQHLMNQQQQLSQQQQAQQQQHHQDIVRSTAAATQQLFSYKMASSFQNPATTGTQSNVSTSTPVGSCMRGGYDYRLATGTGGGGVMDAGQNNLHQQLQGQQQQQHLSSITTQTSTPPVMSPHQLQQLTQQQNNLQQNNAQGLQQRDNMPRGKDSKPRGRMTAYAFFVQTCRQEHKKKHPEEKIVFREFSKKCAMRWKTMSDKEKKRFHEMAEKDKKRYDAEMQNYTPPKGESKGRGKKRKHIKDHNAPKRSLSAFFWFCNDERGKVKMLNPEFGVGDIAKELGKKWSDADPETKSKYEAMAEQDKARYEREMTAYKKKMKDGAPVVANPVNTVKSDSEEEYKEDDE